MRPLAFEEFLLAVAPRAFELLLTPIPLSLWENETGGLFIGIYPAKGERLNLLLHLLEIKQFKPMGHRMIDRIQILTVALLEPQANYRGIRQ